MTKKLTKRQRRVLSFVERFIKKHEIPPTRAEIAKGLGFASDNAAQEHLKAIERKGYITLKPLVSRGVTVI